MQNLTKGELITKLKQIESKKDSNNKQNNVSNQSLTQKFIELFLLVKSILLKITLIALLIKVFKKYRIVKTIFKLINATILGLFGFSVMDIYGSDLLKDCVYYLRNNGIYMWISGLISNKEELQSKLPSSENRSMKRVDWSPTNSKTRIWTEENGDHKNVRRSDKIEIENNDSNNKYYYIALMLLLAGVAFYYKDEIGTGGASLLEWLRTFRSRPGNNTNGNGDGLSTSNPENSVSDIFDRIKSLFKKDNTNQDNLKQSVKDKFTNLDNASQETIKLEPIASSSSRIRIDETVDETMDQYFKDKAGSIPLKTLSAFESKLKNKNIWGSSKGKAKEMDDLTNWEKQFELEKALNKLTMDENISELENMPEIISQITGENWIEFESKSDIVLSQISVFIENHITNNFPTIEVKEAIYATLRGYLLNLSVDHVLYYNWIKIPDVEDKINQFLEIENDIYTDSPEESVLSDEAIKENQAAEEVWSENNVSPENQSTPQQIPRDVISPEQFDDVVQIAQSPVETQPVEEYTQSPVIETDSEIVQDDNELLYSNYSVDELQTHNYNINLSPILSDSSQELETVASPVEQPLINPIITHQTSINNLFDDTIALFDNDDIEELDIGNSSDLIDNARSLDLFQWDNVRVDITRGFSLKDIDVNIKFDELWTELNKFRIILNSGQVIDVDYQTAGSSSNSNRQETINLSNLIDWDTREGWVEVKEVILVDLADQEHSVWTNM